MAAFNASDTGCSTVYAAVSKSDTVNFTQGVTRGIWVGGAGIVQAVDVNDNVVAFTVPAGGFLPIACKRVNSGSSTATLMVALF